MAPEAEETREGVATLGSAEPSAREDTGTPRGEVTEATGSGRAQVLTEMAAPAPRRRADRVTKAEETLEEVATLGAAEPPARGVTGTP